MYQVTQLPPLSYLLDEQPADLTTAARHVGLSPATLQRYRSADAAPRSVMLALFYESKWGYSLLHTTAFNRQMWATGLVSSLRDQNAVLLARIAKLEQLGHFGAANEPMQRLPHGLRADDVIYTGPRRAVLRK